ncbi:hypothetical protein B0H11DRAFT_1929028 [Mycena galericulata]|nr:hypothetical protein B0H11DRAFT_1932585 [Mycena galericulata]KAJ7448698.1 hypothetical protein B0H11DRAFT_1929028 [Mycena galericulata]
MCQRACHQLENSELRSAGLALFIVIQRRGWRYNDRSGHWRLRLDRAHKAPPRSQTDATTASRTKRAKLTSEHYCRQSSSYLQVCRGLPPCLGKPSAAGPFERSAVVSAEKAVQAETAENMSPEGHSLWINLTEDGQKQAHKKTILRTFMDPTFDIDDKKSHDRLLRVRYFSIGGDSWDRTSSTIYSKSTADNHLLKIHGLFATLVCFDKSRVSLAILQCTGIKTVKDGPVTTLEAAPIAEISLPDTRYEISGQILSLVPFEPSDSPGSISWAWATQFVAFESAKAKQASAVDVAARMRHLSITVDGRLVLPLVATDLMQATLEEILHIQPPTVASDPDKTWVFSNAQLNDMGATLRERVQKDEVRLKIPVYGPVKEERYSYEAVIADAPSPKDSRRPCRICQKSVAGPDRQNHMGRHILLSQRDVQEANNTAEVAKNYPCGFCGQGTSDGQCTIKVISGKAVSTCLEWYQFQVKAALKSSGAKPCTNAPIKCSLCAETHWKYNMGQHQDRHPSWEITVPEPSCTVLSSAIAISHEEECRLGIPEAAQSTQPETRSEIASTGQKRAPNSPAGTPRRQRYKRETKTKTRQATAPSFGCSGHQFPQKAGVSREPKSRAAKSGKPTE